MATHPLALFRHPAVSVWQSALHRVLVREGQMSPGLAATAVHPAMEAVSLVAPDVESRGRTRPPTRSETFHRCARLFVRLAMARFARNDDEVARLRSELRFVSCDPLWYEVPKSRKAPKQVKRALDEGAELVFAWGGDGTVQRCIDVLAGTGTPLAIVPAGTANLLATNLGIPQDIEGAVAAGLGGARRAIDVGRLNGERFGVMAGAGLDAAMMRLLLSHGADPSFTVENGTTALMAATGIGAGAPGEDGTNEDALEAVKVCLEFCGGDINAANKDGFTALHGAASRGSNAIVQLQPGVVRD